MMKYTAAVILMGITAISISGVQADPPAVEHVNIVKKIDEIVRENFFDPARLADFDELAATGKSFSREKINEVLLALKASHTGYYTSDQIAYYELADIYSFAITQESSHLFGSDGKVTYPGIGMITAKINNSRFVTDVYDGGPAAIAGVRTGDEILSIDGKPYEEIKSFKNKVGKSVILQLRREQDGQPVDVPVTVNLIEPKKAFTAAVAASIRTIGYHGADIGYIRLWSFTSDETRELIKKEVGSGRLKNADALILDLRSRWGGAPLDAAEIFVGKTPSGEMIARDGKVTVTNVRWNKPVIAIIDKGTRSGLEVFAYALGKNDIPLVGENTAGAVLGATAFLLPNGGLLTLPVMDVRTDGKVLEGIGIRPDIKVARPIPYTGGTDPQLTAALAAIRKKL